MNTSTYQRKSDSNRQILLNGYKISNLQDLRWRAALYQITPLNSKASSTRGSVKEVMWSFKKAKRSLCYGFGFVVELDETQVLVPAHWNIPTATEADGHRFTRLDDIEVNGLDPRWTVAFSRIIKDALRSHLRRVGPPTLGPLWLDYGTLCQLPTQQTENGFAFCRRFDFDPKPLVNGWALRFVASTACIDADSIAHYYMRGKVDELAEMIRAKLSPRTNRKGKPVAVRVLHGTKQGNERVARVLDLFSPEQILDDAKLSQREQVERAKLALQCTDFVEGHVSVSKAQCHLILDTQITQDDHDETILEPEQRADWAARLRDLSHGCEIFGPKLVLMEAPLNSGDFESVQFLPPPIHVRDSFGLTIIDSPADGSPQALRDRAKLRDTHIRKFGFYEHRPISPLLAVPSGTMNEREAEVVRSLLNQLLEDRNIAFRFPKPYFYRDVPSLQRQVEQGKHDSLLVLLPEGRRQAYTNQNTHEQIKRRIPVPSQCICHDNALPFPLRGMSLDEARRREAKLARQMRNQLDLCLLNLLVKAQWFPFIPAERSNYNVHIGLDVGGKLNTTVVAAIGYGFGNPNGGFVFKPVEIEMESHSQQAEPVHPDPLFHGLLGLVEDTRSALEAIGEKPDFDHALFMRDGQLLGDGEEWNEVDALTRLFEHCRDQKWVSENAIWTAVELMKAGDGWRVFERNAKCENPIVGFCCFPFPSPDEGLLCTTGQPYLSQGTAMPLKFRIHQIAGSASRDRVVRDLVWEADMCFTKPDMGQSFPWTLHIADAGALQLSRAYRISGIPV